MKNFIIKFLSFVIAFAFFSKVTFLNYLPEAKAASLKEETAFVREAEQIIPRFRTVLLSTQNTALVLTSSVMQGVKDFFYSIFGGTPEVVPPNPASPSTESNSPKDTPVAREEDIIYTSGPVPTPPPVPERVINRIFSGVTSEHLEQRLAQLRADIDSVRTVASTRSSGGYTSGLARSVNRSNSIQDETMTSLQTQIDGLSGAGYVDTCVNALSPIVLGFGNAAAGATASAVGYCNVACGLNSVVFGRSNFICTAGFASVALGVLNNSTGGTLNVTTGEITGTPVASTTIGRLSTAVGVRNSTGGNQSTAFGLYNTASGCRSSAFGYQNTASGYRSSAFGYQNTASGSQSSAFGFCNTASGNYSSAFGLCNTASGYCSSAFGSCVSNSVSCSTAIGTGSTYMRVESNGYVYFSSGACIDSSGVGYFPSDRNLKENFTELDSSQILASINNLPITKWNYKSQGPSVTHIGPVAQDFFAAFSLGGSDKSISSIDPAGVALLGIQALSKQQASTTLAISDLKLRLDDLQGISASSTSPFSNLSLLQQLQSFGASIIDGVVHFTEVFIEKLNVSKLIIKDSSDVTKTGYVIYDRATGQPICVYFENGVQKTEPGDCDVEVIVPEEEEEEEEEEEGGGEEDITTTTTDPVIDPVPEEVEPEVLDEPAPEPVPEPTPEPTPTEEPSL